MMLRASTTADEVGDRRALLEELVDATVGRDHARAEKARAAIVDRLGADWLADAAAVIANFEMMTRVADATGARLRPEQIEAAHSIRDELGLDAFPTARGLTSR
jgi:hypothetical protein